MTERKPIDTLIPTVPTTQELASLLEDAAIKPGLAGVLGQADDLQPEEYDGLEISRVPGKGRGRGR